MPLGYDRTKGDATTIKFAQTATAEMAIPDFLGKRPEYRRLVGLGYFYTSKAARNYGLKSINLHYISNLAGGGWGGRNPCPPMIRLGFSRWPDRLGRFRGRNGASAE